MEGKRLGEQRELKRVGEPHRLEEQLWVAAYERILPLVRRTRKHQKSVAADERVEELVAADNLARRA
jgi:hypothetical protein